MKLDWVTDVSSPGSLPDGLAAHHGQKPADRDAESIAAHNALFPVASLCPMDFCAFRVLPAWPCKPGCTNSRPLCMSTPAANTPLGRTALAAVQPNKALGRTAIAAYLFA